MCVLSCGRLFSIPLADSLPGSSVHGIFQARKLELVSRDWTHFSCASWIGNKVLYHCVTWEAPTISLTFLYPDLVSCLFSYIFICILLYSLYFGKLCFSFPGAASSFLIIPFSTASISCLVDTKLFLPFWRCSLDCFWAFPWPSASSPSSSSVWADFCLPCGWKLVWWGAGSSCPWC